MVLFLQLSLSSCVVRKLVPIILAACSFWLWAGVWATCVCPHSPSLAGAGTPAGTLSGAPPAVPSWLLPFTTTSGTSQAGASAPVEASAGTSVVQSPGAGATSLAAAVPTQSGS